MTKTLFVALVALVAGALRAESPEQFFVQANQLYQQGNYAGAIVKYEAVLKTGVASGEVYYNLGNAYYKSSNIGKAILNYERALRLMPTDDDLRHNLQLANLMITDRIDPTPRLFIWDWWDAIKTSISLTAATWVMSFFFFLLIGAIVLAILAPSYARRRLAFFGSLACAVLLALSVVVFVGKLNQVESRSEGIVTANITTIKNSPDAKSSDAFVLHAGVKVFIIDNVERWYKIRLLDGKVGWMEQGAVEII
ncbi:MAG: tetratricopeptide repeat protein [Ignavibacteriae bacterium]|nr:tetratricopeptide repeat protein [Ignavibacteriota bacterium]